MITSIKITPDLEFDYTDLSLEIDFSQKFTLRDIIRTVVSSKIPMPILTRILRCPYLIDYHKEIESRPFEDGGDIEYLELYWFGDKDKVMNSQWGFHGVGRSGNEKIKEYYKEHGLEDIPEDYRERYAIGFSPLYKLADYRTQLCKEMVIADWKTNNVDDQRINFTPSISLITFLYWVFWELSWYGSPENRTKKLNDLEDRCDKFEKIDLKSFKSSKDVFKEIKNKFKEAK